jgi:hypothetical protein
MNKQEMLNRIEFCKNLGNGSGNIIRTYEREVKHYQYEVEHARSPEEIKKALAGLTNAYNIIISHKVSEAVNLAEAERLEKEMKRE